ARRLQRRHEGNEARGRRDSQLLHDTSPVMFDRPHADAQATRDDLARLAFDQKVQDLRLARGQRPEPKSEVGHLRFMIADGDRATRRFPHALQEHGRVKRLLDEVHHAFFQSRYRHRNVAMARDHDRGRGRPGEPIHPRQTDVRQKADRLQGGLAGEERFGVRIALNLVPFGAKQQFDCYTHPFVILDDEHRLLRRHRRAPLLSGSSRTNLEPVASVRSSHNRPPWALMISRLRERPSPMPRRLVVSNGSNRRSRISGATPGPLSSTSTRTAPGERERVAWTLRSPPTSLWAAASIAFRIKFARTCSICMRSAATKAGAGALTRIATPWARASSASAPPSRRKTSLRSIESQRNSPRSRKRRMRSTIAPARWVSCSTFSTVSRSNSALRGFSSKSRLLECANAAAAAKGWLISCTTAAPNAPTVVSLACRASSACWRRRSSSACWRWVTTAPRVSP